MPKYKNTTEFIKPMVVNGKRIAVKPNDIIFSERELDIAIFSFLEKVDDKLQISKVKELGPQKITVAKPEDVNQVRKQISDVISRVDIIKDTPQQIVELTKVINELKDDILKKLNIMKDAIETVVDEQEEIKNVVHDLENEVYENGAIVIEGLEDKKE